MLERPLCCFFIAHDIIIIGYFHCRQHPTLLNGPFMKSPKKPLFEISTLKFQRFHWKPLVFDYFNSRHMLHTKQLNLSTIPQQFTVISALSPIKYFKLTDKCTLLHRKIWDVQRRDNFYFFVGNSHFKCGTFIFDELQEICQIIFLNQIG